MPGFDPRTPLPRATVVDRRRFLIERATGKRVVHLGCVDDRLTVERARTGDLLHEELAAVAAEVLGVDISREGLEIIEGLIPGPYLYGDVERLDEVDLPDDCDLVIASELIEHLGNPMLFLEGLRDYLARTGATALITTPNALSWRLFSAALVSREEVSHPDHLLLYSPVTLAESLRRAGLTTTQLLSHTWERKSGLRNVVVGTVDRLLLARSPWVGVGIVAEVRAGG